MRCTLLMHHPEMTAEATGELVVQDGPLADTKEQLGGTV